MRYFQYKNKRINMPLTKILRANKLATEFGLAKMKGRKEAPRLPLDAISEKCESHVRTSLEEVLRTMNSGKSVFYLSNALQREVVYAFQRVIQHLSSHFDKVDYLEIGSAQGASISLVALLLKERNLLGRLVSVDPYFQDGYLQDDGFAKEGKKDRIEIDKSTKDVALTLYKELGLDVELLEQMSQTALSSLLSSGLKFNLIYIDGNHGGFYPLIDFGLCANLICPGGIIILDDHYYPDVRIIKRLCDKYLEKIYEMWKIAAYRWETEES